MSARIALSRDGREFEPGHWYGPRRTGPCTKARFLREVRRDGVHEDWAVYEVLDNDARRITRSCTLSVWCRWAGEKVAS
jgi:hypothetical protein